LALTLLLLSACAEEHTPPADQAVSGLRVNTLLGGVTDEGYRHANQPRDFVFPRDHGAHPGFRSEWWYLTAMLADPQGREYGAQFTLFRQALTPQAPGPGPWQTGQAFLAHLAVADVDRGQHLEAQRFARGHPQLASVRTEGGLSLRIEDWLLEQQPHDAQFTVRVTAQDLSSDGRTIAVDLEASQQQAIVLQGERGLSMKSAEGGSYYYSMPRLQVRGTLKFDDRSVPVSGLAWLDREWSTSILSAGVAGWDWFALHLDDGRSIMAFQLRREDGTRDKFDHGIEIEAKAAEQGVIGLGDPGVRVLTPADYSLQPQRYWQDPHGVRWPVSWTLQLDDTVFAIEALFDDQVMDTSILYWEGIVAVRDNSGQDVGRGYMELTGYTAEKP
jgi:predicted secreted hydrolase